MQLSKYVFTNTKVQTLWQMWDIAKELITHRAAGQALTLVSMQSCTRVSGDCVEEGAGERAEKRRRGGGECGGEGAARAAAAAAGWRGSEGMDGEYSDSGGGKDLEATVMTSVPLPPAGGCYRPSSAAGGSDNSGDHRPFQ